MLESSRHAENLSDAGCSAVDGDGDDEDDEARKTMAAAEIEPDDDDDGEKRPTAKRGFGRAKQVISYPFRKAKKQILRRKIKRASSSPITATRRTVSSDKRAAIDGSVNQGCGFCFKELISDSKNGSQTTDPNHRKFTNEMLRVLIEKNDFYSKECNPHLESKVETRQKKQ